MMTNDSELNQLGSFRTCRYFFQAITILGFISSHVFAVEPWQRNPWYWSQDGEPVLLLGGSDDDNLFQWPAEKLIPQLDRIVAAGGNVIRNTMSDRRDGGFEVYPFLQLESGKFDLAQWNPEYWERFDRLLTETAKREIFVQIEIWDRFDYSDVREHDPKRWEKHPYSPANNVNYSFEESTFARRYPRHPGANDQPFFFTTPKQRNITAVLKFQEAFVNKLLDHSLKHGHVLYCMDNETKAEPEWGEYWARLVRQRARADGKQVMITEMWDDWDLKARRHRQTFDHPQLYDFVDVSQNNQNSGQDHWDNFLYVRSYLAEQPRPMNTTKTYGADGNKFNHTDQDAIERFWRHLLAGAASIRFHRPPSGLGINNKAVACIQAARKVEEIVPLWNVEPANELLKNRAANEAYAAASPNRDAILLYFPASQNERSVSLDINPATGRYVQWVNIDTGDKAGQEALSGRVISPPQRGNFVAVIQQNQDQVNVHSMIFPGEEWERTSPESQGVDSAALNSAAEYLRQNSGRDGVKELVIIRNGRMIWAGDGIDKQHGVWSLTKSITSTVLGLLIDDGKTALDVAAVQYVPAMGNAFPDVTLRHFTTMTSGYYAVGDEPKGSYTHGPSRTPFHPHTTPLFSPPGSKYAYWDSAMNQFAHVLTRIAEEPIEELFQMRIADPIGMNRDKWDWGDFGQVNGIVVNGGAGNSGNHIQISARELARFGHLFLNRGNWKGKQLISAEWVDAATKTQVLANTPMANAELSDAHGPGCYGYNWWTNGTDADGKMKWPGAPADTYAASGYNNNDLFVVPSWHVVIVRLGLDENDQKITDEVHGTFLKKIGEAIELKNVPK